MILLTVTAPQSATAECTVGACCREVACTCPDSCETAAPGDTQADEDTLICLGPDTPDDIVRALGSVQLLEFGKKTIISHPGGIRVVRNVGPGPAFNTWNQLRESIRRFGGTVEPDHTYRLQSPPPTPNDPQFDDQWPAIGWSNGKSCSSSSVWCDPDCNADASLSPLAPWDTVNQTPPGTAVVLGMIDALPHRHSDLDDNIWTNPAPAQADEYPNDLHGYNAVNGLGISDFTLDNASTSGTNHGLSVASIMAALGNNTENMAGMVWDADVILCNASTRVSQYAACLRYFAVMRESGVNLVAVNVSGGGTRCSCCVERYVRRLRELGVLVVAAAGNDGCANGPFEPDRDRCQTWASSTSDPKCGECPFYPASHPVSNVISVGASTCSSAPKYCSNYGRRSVHLFAPGHDILTLGDPAFTFTSAAAPHVTGTVGLLASTPSGTTLDWRGLRSRILAGGRPSASLLTTTAPEVQERAEQTISRRNLLTWDEEVAGQALGAVSCKDQKVKRRLLPLEDTVTIATTGSVLLRAIGITCAQSDMGVPVQVQKKSGTTWTNFGQIVLNDDGQAPDECKEDGEHAREWTAPAGEYRLRLWSGAQPEEDLEVTVTP